jgi:hypothetical protein
VSRGSPDSQVNGSISPSAPIRGCAQARIGIFPPKSRRPTLAGSAVSAWGGEASAAPERTLRKEHLLVVGPVDRRSPGVIQGTGVEQIRDVSESVLSLGKHA